MAPLVRPLSPFSSTIISPPPSGWKAFSSPPSFTLSTVGSVAIQVWLRQTTTLTQPRAKKAQRLLLLLASAKYGGATVYQRRKSSYFHKICKLISLKVLFLMFQQAVIAWRPRETIALGAFPSPASSPASGGGDPVRSVDSHAQLLY